MYLNHAVSVEVAFGENFCRRSIFREAWTHFKTPAGNVSVKTGSNPKLVLTSTGEPVFSAEGSLSEHGESCCSADTTGWLWRCTHSKHALRNQSERCTDMLILRDGSLVYGGCDNSSVCIRVCVCVFTAECSCSEEQWCVFVHRCLGQPSVCRGLTSGFGASFRGTRQVSPAESASFI